MNITEAAIEAKLSKKICKGMTGEWLVLSGAVFRYASNRTEVRFTLDDLTSNEWRTDEDIVYLSKITIANTLKKHIAMKKDFTKTDDLVSGVICDLTKNQEKAPPA
jgi:hypothetical protein